MLRRTNLVRMTAASALLAACPAAAGPLEKLPSKPGPHVARIQALGSDSWLELGAPAPDPKWGRARGRSWTPRMPYAPALRAALLCGCGQHGFVKPDGHFQDDLWAYDIPAHRWVCVYPGANTKQLKLHLDARGFEVDAKGRHVPVSFLGHGYCNQTYVPHLRRLMIVYTHNPWWTRAIPQRWSWLDANDPDVRRRNYGHAGPVIENPKHPLFYDVTGGRWRRVFVAGDGPGPRLFEGLLEYIPPRRQAFFLYRGRVWFYDFERNRWVDPKADRAKIGYDCNGCYDAKRNCVYVVRREGFWAFDIDRNRWRTIRARGQPENLGNSNGAAIAYDPVGDVVVHFRTGGVGIRIYDPKADAWTPAAVPPKVQWKYRGVNAFYDPVLNAHFYHLAGDSRDNGFMLVYRHRARPAKAEARGAGH